MTMTTLLLRRTTRWTARKSRRILGLIMMVVEQVHFGGWSGEFRVIFRIYSFAGCTSLDFIFLRDIFSM